MLTANLSSVQCAFIHRNKDVFTLKHRREFSILMHDSWMLTSGGLNSMYGHSALAVGWTVFCTISWTKNSERLHPHCDGWCWSNPYM